MTSAHALNYSAMADQRRLKMKLYTTDQLKASLPELYKRNDLAGEIAYRLTFDELEERMGDDFDEYLETLDW